MIGNVALDGAEIYLETLKDGRSNLDALSNKSSETASSTNTAEPKVESAPVEAAKSTDTVLIPSSGILTWPVFPLPMLYSK